ncbi:MAG: hypothetical protein CM15mP58_12900 [Burkholderiaceae bacterium]|nr:MAG: hypothetical protein CM15mP58_12900 [Burkholderiaceae bacterium]
MDCVGLPKQSPQKKNDKFGIGTPHHGETVELLGKYKTESNGICPTNLLNKIRGGPMDPLKGPGTLVGPNPHMSITFPGFCNCGKGGGRSCGNCGKGMIAHGYSKAGALATHIHSESAKKN